MNFKLGIQMEHDDPHHQHVRWPQMSKIKVLTSCRQFDACLPITRQKKSQKQHCCNQLHWQLPGYISLGPQMYLWTSSLSNQPSPSRWQRSLSEDTLACMPVHNNNSRISKIGGKGVRATGDIAYQGQRSRSPDG